MPAPSAITLDKDRLVFLLRLLAYIVVAAPHHSWGKEQELTRANPGWNPLRFRRDRVWRFLHGTLADKDIYLKDGIREHLLLDAQRNVNANPSAMTYEIVSIFSDELMRLTYNRNAHAVRACIESVAAILLSRTLPHFEDLLCDEPELVCGQTHPDDTARAPEQPGAPAGRITSRS